MAAAINSAAAYYEQLGDATLDLTSYVPLPAVITGLQANGNRVDAVVSRPSAVDQTPQGDFVVRHIAYVDTGATPPTTGPFVTEAGWTPPAPPQSGGSGGSGGSGS